jgi:hypothetical protein
MHLACGAGRHLACHYNTPLRTADSTATWGVRSRHASAFFSFIRHFPFVEDGAGGVYLSGQSSNPANRPHLRIDLSIGVGRSFSEFRTCCIG